MTRPLFRRAIALLIVTLLACGGPVSAGAALAASPAPSGETGRADSADTQYHALVRESRAMPADFDFAALRALYVRTSFYSAAGDAPYRDRLMEALTKAQAAPDIAVPEIEEIAANQAAHYKLHSYILSASHGQRLRRVDTDWHEWMLRGLFRAILESGDGKSPQTAYAVLDKDEETLVLTSFMGLAETGREAVAESAGTTRITARNPGSGSEQTLYFRMPSP